MKTINGVFDLTQLEHIKPVSTIFDPITDMKQYRNRLNVDMSYALFNLGFGDNYSGINSNISSLGVLAPISEILNSDPSEPSRGKITIPNFPSETVMPPEKLNPAQQYIKQAVEAAFPNDPYAWISTYNIVKHECSWVNSPPDSGGNPNSSGYFGQGPGTHDFGSAQEYTYTVAEQTQMFINYIKHDVTIYGGTPSGAWAQYYNHLLPNGRPNSIPRGSGPGY